MNRVAFVLVALASLFLLASCGTLQVGIERTAAPTGTAAVTALATATVEAVSTSIAAATTSIAPTATVSATPEVVKLALYSDTRFAVSLSYPSHWQPTPGGEARYEASDGFFALDAVGNPDATIDDIAADQVGHRLRPYGSQPSVETLTIQGQEARLILPSADANMAGQAMLIVRYPQPIQFGEPCQFFVLYADQDHIRSLAQTLVFHTNASSSQPPLSSWISPGANPAGTPVPSSELISTPAVDPQIISFQVAPAVVKPGDVVTLSWEAKGDRATICPSARFVLFTADDCWQASLSGMTAFTIPLGTGGNRAIDFLLTVEVEGSANPAMWHSSVAFRCLTTWFFSDEPQAGTCPLDPLESAAAAQRFERGTMIWIEQLGRYVILAHEPLHENDGRKRFALVQDPLDIARDTSTDVAAPDGFYAPTSGFGLIWRGDVAGSPGYRETLGWALAPEFGYDATFQCDDALPSGGLSWQTCYLQGPDGEVIVLDPLGRWYLWDGGTEG